MNNNYHTQMDKQNILNEIAANNNLLQQQMQNFPGTPINKPMVQTPSMQPLTPQQIMYTQMVQQNSRMNTQGQTQLFPTIPQQTQQTNEDEEAKPIELSSDRPVDNDNNDKQKQQINKQIQQVLHSNNQTKKPDKPAPKMQAPYPSLPPNLPYPLPPPPAPTSKMSEYVIMPIVIFAAFVLLVHPSTSKYFDKYLPSITNTKGLLIRGVILVIVYVVARFILTMFGK